MDAYSHEDRPTPVFLASPPTDRATLACQPCRRRKAKCDRLLPSCNVCARTLQTCIYPAKRLKPGPKIGSTQRGRKRVRFSSHGSGASQDFNDLPRGYPASAQESAARPEHSVVSDPQQPFREPSGIPASQAPYQPLLSKSSQSPESFSTAPRHSPDDEAEQSASEMANITASFLETMNLANIMHPTHEKLTGESSTSPPPQPDYTPMGEPESFQRILHACHDLGLSFDQLRILGRAYLANMTTITLFHHPTIRQTLWSIGNILHLKALIASICSFSARFVSGYPDAQMPPGEIPVMQDHSRFHYLGVKWVFEAINTCEDEAPPLCVLQALVLTTFYKMTEGVRGRAWRLLGTCVRIAYEQRLNFIDIDRAEECNDIGKWTIDEARRRCWWAIWEMDIFASSVRRGPTAIDWATNETYLPVSDEAWFNGQYQKSCCLELKPMDRVKALETSGNRSPDAWHIVLESIMRDAQLLSNMSTVLPDIDPQNNVALMIHYFQHQFKGKKLEEAERKLPELGDALRAFTTALPAELSYKGEFLTFMKNEPSCTATIVGRRLDAAKYRIHLTFNHTKVMINHHYAFREVVAGNRTTENSRHTTVNWNATGPEIPTNAQGLQNCMDAADDILEILTQCTDQHVQFVNPLLASIVWLATALQVLRKVFAGDSNSDFIVKKCQLLRGHCEQYVQVWGTPMALMENLDSLEERLREKQKQRYDGHFAPQPAAFQMKREETHSLSRNEQNAQPQSNNLDWEEWQQTHYYFNPDAGFNTVQGIPTERYVQGIPMQEYMPGPYPGLANGEASHNPFTSNPSISNPSMSSVPAPPIPPQPMGNIDPTMDFDNGFSVYLQALMTESYPRH